jgi:8-oxo-dGTP diphosphatase
MSDNNNSRRPTISVDVVSLVADAGDLLVRLTAVAGSRQRALPNRPVAPGESLTAAAAKVLREIGAPRAGWMEQVGAFGEELRHPSDTALSVGYAAVFPTWFDEPAPSDGIWAPVTKLPQLAPRHRAMIEAAVDLVRHRLDVTPVAFHFLPSEFTLSELQQVYETLLGRALHKASFRRALHAAGLVAPTSEWRSEGRGRPAQLFRYHPRKRRRVERGVRFELVGA